MKWENFIDVDTFSGQIFRKFHRNKYGYSRPHYYYLIDKTIKEARNLGYNIFSIVELGVAGGNGLLEIENILKNLPPSKIDGLEIEVYDFDRSIGLPKPVDYKGLPYFW